MKDIILGVLKSKGSLKEKSLWKKVAKKLGYDQEDRDVMESGEDREVFVGMIQDMLDSHELILHNNELSINKNTSSIVSKKHSREGVTPAPEESRGKKKLKAEPEVPPVENPQQTWNYPEMWKNGEKFWKEGTLHPDYLRTNPDQ